MWGGGPIPEELSGFPGYLLARLGDRSRRRFHDMLAPLGLHPRHFGAMTVVAANPGLSQQQLHERTAIDASSIVGLLDELEAKGLAERRPYPGDRRARTIVLSAKGQRTLQEARSLAQGLQAELLAPLSAAERRTLLELLRKLARSSR